MNSFNNLIKSCLSKIGIVIRKEDPAWSFVPYSSTPEGIYQELLKKHKIDLILDIGASTGYWAANLRENGYKGRIVSFEPQDTACNQIVARSKLDANWELMRFAIGDKDENANFHLSNHSESSSLSEMLKSHEDAFPASYNTNKNIQVTVRTLDTLLPNILNKEENIFTKIDVQGFEQKVLTGANESLKKIKMLQLEISLKKLYADDVLFNELYKYMNDLGFYLIYISPGFKNDQTGELLQVDAIFVRKS